MLSTSHVLCTVLACKGDKTYLDEHLSSVVLPDAIRAYTGRREYSHFECADVVQTNETSDVSYMRFPADMKHMTKESIMAGLSKDGHLAEKSGNSVVGEKTDRSMFERTNKHLPAPMFDGISTHLRQDVIFDAMIRKNIDVTGRYEDRFIFHDENADILMDGKQVRELIGNVEQHITYLFAKEIYEQTGILCDQSWFDENVKPILERDYPSDLAETTYKYMQIRTQENEWIKNKDWTHEDVMDIPYRETKEALLGMVNVCTPEHLRNTSDMLDFDEAVEQLSSNLNEEMEL